MTKIKKDSIQNAIPERTKNFKINTRIVITSVLAIIIPIIIIATVAIITFSTTKNNYDISSVTTQSYSIVNQIQWSQTINELSAELLSSENEEEKYTNVVKYVSPLEECSSLIYIEKNGELFYSTASDIDVLKRAEEIADIKIDENSYHFSESGIVIINHATDENSSYLIVIVNDNYRVPNSTAGSSVQNIIGNLTSKAAIILSLSGATFIIAIIIISLITSKTIIGPIQKITKGANEIANGNLDYEIDYTSTNELGQLAESFNDMRLRVKESIEERNKADQQQKEVVAGIAHDLRTPLTSVKGYMEGLRDGIADTPEKQSRYLNTIYDSTCAMEKMLNDLLTISKLELGSITLNCEEVTLSDFIGFAEERGTELKKEGFDFELINNSKSDSKMNIDTDRFSRVIDNIISNSIKYRRPDIKGKISFSISEYEHSIIFELADNGMGVDLESLPRIFDTLYRADKARSNVSDGSGLGLSVCKQIVELHGGMIWAQGNSYQGLSVFISLPKIENNQEKLQNEKNSYS